MASEFETAAGGIVMDLTGQSARTVYRQSIGARITGGMAVSIPGFDPARGVVFLISSGYPFGNVPSYRSIWKCNYSFSCETDLQMLPMS
uniref:Uncharacterized protein n=1 Tax=Pseudomonas phage PACT201 TaxID=3230130 RepID=A0AAU8GSB1_9VIRU